MTEIGVPNSGNLLGTLYPSWPALWRPAWWAPDGFAAIPTTALDLPLVQRLRRSPRFRVRVPISKIVTIAALPRGGADEKGQQIAPRLWVRKYRGGHICEGLNNPDECSRCSRNPAGMRGAVSASPISATRFFKILDTSGLRSTRISSGEASTNDNDRPCHVTVTRSDLCSICGTVDPFPFATDDNRLRRISHSDSVHDYGCTR